MTHQGINLDSYVPVNCLPTAPSLSNTLGLKSLAPVAGFVPDVAFDPGAGADAMMTDRISTLNGNLMSKNFRTGIAFDKEFVSV